MRLTASEMTEVEKEVTHIVRHHFSPGEIDRGEAEALCRHVSSVVSSPVCIFCANHQLSECCRVRQIITMMEKYNVIRVDYNVRRRIQREVHCPLLALK